MHQKPIVRLLFCGSSALKPHDRLLVAALLFIALITGLSLWLVHASAPADASGRLRHSGSLRVGFAVEAPYAFIDAHGQITGEAPEIFRRMAQRMGVQHIDWVRMDFASLLPALQIGRIDAVAAGMFITPERQRVVIFSRPTASVRSALIVQAGEKRLPLKPLLADLEKASGMRWVTVHDAAENGLLFQAGVPTERISTVPQADRALRVLAEGKADGMAISAVTAWKLVAQTAGQALQARVLADAPAGLPAFAFRAEDDDLRDAMDRALTDFLGSEEHMVLVRSFGFTSEERPPEPP